MRKESCVDMPAVAILIGLIPDTQDPLVLFQLSTSQDTYVLFQTRLQRDMRKHGGLFQLEHMCSFPKTQDFVSKTVEIEDGLHPGSPYSVIYCISYTIPACSSPAQSRSRPEISLGVVDDVAYLVANDKVEKNVLAPQAEEKILNVLQNEANRLALGAFKHSPSAFQAHDANLPQIRTQQRKFLIRALQTTPNNHRSAIHQTLGKDSLVPYDKATFEVMFPFPADPWDKPLGQINNITCSREEEVKFVSTQAKELKFARRVALGPQKGISNYKAEAWSFLLALERCEEVLTKFAFIPRSVAIFCDNQSALRLLNEPPRQRTAQYLAIWLWSLAEMIMRQIKLELYWSPGHEEIPLNERADEVAGKAAESGRDLMHLRVSLTYLKAQAKKTCFIRGVPLNRPPFVTSAVKIADALDDSEKRSSGNVFSSYDRVTALFDITTSEFKWKIQQPVRIAAWKEKIKTRFRDATKLPATPKAIKYIVKSVKAIGRFPHLRSYNTVVEDS
ncbi:hypothetical protein CROQUDRAFT_109423 [Cronartium quercuum f. sp. fusiforme G11]|uniref:RNase H type-1 domain-containing protein n=1 Tax=Cronartium quercuum f. sp. fusiforme G11 TaxID=708437 RepID=A0A9P6NFM1_9BASI|nr:hypothetical protein CROQUDRAFT_109423 [Cronartium quercuum f. sp. fusiforme G11]